MRSHINTSLDCENLMTTCKIQVMEKCKQVKAKLKVTKVFIIQHSLLVCKVVQGHIHKESCVFYHNSFSRAQHSCFDILKIFVSLCCHDIRKFCELKVPLK